MIAGPNCRPTCSVANDTTQANPASATVATTNVGTPGAPVVIAEFSDFECQYCREEAKTLRTNLLGFAVAQIDYAHPFDRPGRGWVWGFSLTPGF